MLRYIAVLLLTLCMNLLAVSLAGQSLPVPKTYSKPVFMHYMPWFDTPEFNGYWGWHWKMNTQDPDSIAPLTNKRQIASHYYPLIGPYASKDPDVIEYHLLLMKYAGVDGVLINWYGIEGSNGDINSLLTNSNALISKVDDVGLEFGIVFEDRFADSIQNSQNNVAYARDNYFNDSSYFRFGAGNDPVMPVFGPIKFETELEWDSILSYAGEDVEFLPLWYEKIDAGANSDGEFAWIYEIDSLDDFSTRLNSFYTSRAPTLGTAMGIAYPGFEDFYFEGGAGNGFFTIPHDTGNTIDTTLGLLNTYDSDIDMVQLATWNDFGEGTMFEPTCEFGFSFLDSLQNFLGVSYGVSELSNIYQLYSFRKQCSANPIIQNHLDDVFDHFVALEVVNAANLLDSLRDSAVCIQPDTTRWHGAADSNWFNTANWTPCLLPDFNNVVQIPGTSATIRQPFIGEAAECKKLFLENSAKVEILSGGSLIIKIDP